MDYINEIREYIEYGYKPKKPHELYIDICGENSCDFEKFFDALKKLEDNGEIVYTKKGKIVGLSDSDCIKGVFRASARGFGFVTPHDCKNGESDFFIPAEYTSDAIDGDTVLVSPSYGASYRTKNMKREGKIVRILDRGLTHLIGTVYMSHARKKRRPLFYVVPDNRRCAFDIIIEYETMPDCETGDKVEVELIRYPTRKTPARGRIKTVFGASDSKEANYAAILHSHGIRTEFPKSVLEEADRQASTPVLPESRLDLREELIITIDGADAKDLDDAISVKRTDDGYLLGVHIADVSHYVRENSELDKEAIRRGTSVYFADKVVPMLPKALSNGICSLNAHTDKYTLSALISLNKKGEIMSAELCESIINSKIRGVYSELNDIIENGEKSEFYPKYSLLFPDTFPLMLELYKVLDKKSKNKGALDLETTEAKIILNENNEPIDIAERTRGTTEMLIEQFMLCANEAVASRLSWQDMPCVYRIHEDPDADKVRNFEIFAYNAGLDTAPLKAKTLHPSAFGKILKEAETKGMEGIISGVMLRSLMKARYSPSPSRHFGLATDKYCHFTSPIRRYPDLATHRIIKKVIRGAINADNIDHWNAFAAQAAAESNENELRAMAAERDVEDLYKAMFMMKSIGEQYKGIIVSVTSFGFFVKLENTCEGLVPIASLDGYFAFDEDTLSLVCDEERYTIGQEIEVIIDDVDLISRKIDMRLV